MNLVNALRFCPLSAILSLSLLWRVVVVMVALVFNNQVNNNFRYKLLKLLVASKVGFHNSNKSLCESVHNFFPAVNIDYLCFVNYVHPWWFFLIHGCTPKCTHYELVLIYIVICKYLFILLKYSQEINTYSE